MSLGRVLSRSEVRDDNDAAFYSSNLPTPRPSGVAEAKVILRTKLSLLQFKESGEKEAEAPRKSALVSFWKKTETCQWPQLPHHENPHSDRVGTAGGGAAASQERLGTPASPPSPGAWPPTCLPPLGSLSTKSQNSMLLNPVKPLFYLRAFQTAFLTLRKKKVSHYSSALTHAHVCS